VRSRPDGGTFHIEDVQDQVELGLMRAGHHDVARAYVLYRERRNQERAEQKKPPKWPPLPQARAACDRQRPARAAGRGAPAGLIVASCRHLNADVQSEPILAETLRNLYDGVPMDEVYKAAILAARTLIEKTPTTPTSPPACCCTPSCKKSWAAKCSPPKWQAAMPSTSRHQKGVDSRAARREAAELRPAKLAAALKAERDLQFDYLGLQTLYDRYFLHVRKCRIELPQAFFMRVAMGLALNEIDREARAIEFYELLSSFDFMSSTPTLFNSGTRARSCRPAT
jgi:ribonucleoside-diphosphate reductase alpha chain